jgi:hypothetical protein
MTTLQSSSVTYITPTFARDIEQFALLRQSMRVFSEGVAHLAFVHSEDCDLFVIASRTNRDWKLCQLAKFYRNL